MKLSESRLTNLRKSIPIASPLEIILFEGAKLVISKTGFLDVPYSLPRADQLYYCSCKEMTDKMGKVIIGFVEEITENHFLMSPGIEFGTYMDLPKYIVYHECIKAISTLSEQEFFKVIP
ncbi:MAG: hypothetical protein AABX39_01550 [Nanoarchaeota archaeon]